MTATLLTTLLCMACAGEQLRVHQTDTGFVESNHLLFIAENNRLSRMYMGNEVKFDDIGVYLDPFVEKDKTTGEIILLGLKIINKPPPDMRVAEAARLGEIRKVSFLLNTGEHMTLAVENQETTHSPVVLYEAWGSDNRKLEPYEGSFQLIQQTQETSSAIETWETGVIPMSEQEFNQLAGAQVVSCEIVGSRGTTTYRESDISDTFSKNLQTFYLEYVR